jgi:hypothetical protein
MIPESRKTEIPLLAESANMVARLHFAAKTLSAKMI